MMIYDEGRMGINPALQPNSSFHGCRIPWFQGVRPDPEIETQWLLLGIMGIWTNGLDNLIWNLGVCKNGTGFDLENHVEVHQYLATWTSNSVTMGIYTYIYIIHRRFYGDIINGMSLSIYILIYISQWDIWPEIKSYYNRYNPCQ